MAEYKGTVELIGGLTPKNNGIFPLASAKDIQVDETGKRLDEKLSELEKGGGSGEPGADGITPHIGENGHWFIGDEDTGVKAQGEDGAYPTDLAEMGGDTTKTTYRLEFSNGTGYDFDVYHGEKGDPGEPGPPGPGGKSAYELWLAEGNTGSVDDFLASLQGADGTTQVTPLDAESVEWLEENGEQGKLYVLMDKTDPNYGFIYHYAEVETEVESGPAYTNLLPTATDTDGSIYNGIGYKTSTRLSGSSGSTATATDANMCASGFIPAVVDDTVRIKGSSPVKGVVSYVIAYDSTNARIKNQGFAQTSDGSDWSTAETWYTYADGILTFKLTSENFGTGFASFRFSGHMDENTIVTVNEEIKEGGGTTIVKEWKWISTGHAFVSANYEPRIIAVEEKAASNTARIISLENGLSNVPATQQEALTLIRDWNAPIYDTDSVVLIDSEKEAITNKSTVDAVYAAYDALMAQYPRYITKTLLGNASDGTTPIYRYDFNWPRAHKYTGGYNPDLEKPKAIIVSGIHYEWVGIWALYYALEEIATNPDFSYLRRNAHLIVVPVMNPYCLLPGNYNVTNGRKNANGVEIHRNFTVEWEKNTAVEGDNNWGGTAPLSEVESQYVDQIMSDNRDAAFFMSCHNFDAGGGSTYGTSFIWPSTATNYLYNLGSTFILKMSEAWEEKYGQTWRDGVDSNKTDAQPDGDYTVGNVGRSTTPGTEAKHSMLYGIHGATVEVGGNMQVLGASGGDSVTMSRGAEVYANFIKTAFACFDKKDKSLYAPVAAVDIDE